MANLEYSPEVESSRKSLKIKTSQYHGDRYLSNLLLHALLEEMDSLESKNGEDDRTGVDSSEAVTEGDDDDVLNTVLLGVVVRPEADDGAESQTEGVENLVCSIKPDCGFE